ncbi:MAG TPA: hypothetical protein VHL85_00275 [Burkholderiales bacterium]|jgi:hypothetical protein|nr:hypothetical protein [Burkholderiales bacterium]
MERSTRLAPSLRWSLYGTGLALLASGAAWLCVRYGVPEASRPRGVLTISMRIHGAAAMGALGLIGAVTALHVKAAWLERRNIATGVGLAGSLLAIAITGYLLYYVGDEAARSVASAAHWLLGIAAPIALWWHTAAGAAPRAD